MSINTIHFCAILEPINWFVNLFSNFEHFGVLFYFSILAITLALFYFMDGRKIKISLELGSQVATIIGAAAGVGQYYQGKPKKAVEVTAKPKDTPTNKEGNSGNSGGSSQKAFSVLALLGVNVDKIPETDLSVLAYAFLVLL
jgi:hypothetical protein